MGQGTSLGNAWNSSFRRDKSRRQSRISWRPYCWRTTNSHLLRSGKQSCDFPLESGQSIVLTKLHPSPSHNFIQDHEYWTRLWIGDRRNIRFLVGLQVGLLVNHRNAHGWRIVSALSCPAGNNSCLTFFFPNRPLTAAREEGLEEQEDWDDCRGLVE